MQSSTSSSRSWAAIARTASALSANVGKPEQVPGLSLCRFHGRADPREEPVHPVRPCGRRAGSRPRGQGGRFGKQAFGLAPAVNLPCARRAARSPAAVPICSRLGFRGAAALAGVRRRPDVKGVGFPPSQDARTLPLLSPSISVVYNAVQPRFRELPQVEHGEPLARASPHVLGLRQGF